MLDTVIHSSPHRLAEAGVASVPIQAITDEGVESRVDRLAVEEPLEIRLVYREDGRRRELSLAVTMRTPGQDVELALGFLYGEGVVRRREDVEAALSSGRESSRERQENVVVVYLAPNVTFDASRLERHFYATSSCGVCGKTSIDAISTVSPGDLPSGPRVEAGVLASLPGALRQVQQIFELTGGLHAAALFDASGLLHAVREDVGRHNAFDKLVGAFFFADRLPLHDSVVLVSGRASFELVQKAAMAGIPVMAAVGAPSSLAVELATSHGMTLAGFVRAGRVNVYAGPERVDAGSERIHPGPESGVALQRAATAPPRDSGAPAE